MKEKIKKYLLIIFYTLIWLIFFFLLSGIVAGLSDIQTVISGKWWLFLIVVLGWFLSIYLLRHQFKSLKNKLFSLLNWIWRRERIKKNLIILIIFLILAGIGVGIWRYQDRKYQTKMIKLEACLSSCGCSTILTHIIPWCDDFKCADKCREKYGSTWEEYIEWKRIK